MGLLSEMDVGGVEWQLTLSLLSEMDYLEGENFGLVVRDALDERSSVNGKVGARDALKTRGSADGEVER